MCSNEYEWFDEVCVIVLRGCACENDKDGRGIFGAVGKDDCIYMTGGPHRLDLNRVPLED